MESPFLILSNRNQPGAWLQGSILTLHGQAEEPSERGPAPGCLYHLLLVLLLLELVGGVDRLLNDPRSESEVGLSTLNSSAALSSRGLVTDHHEVLVGQAFDVEAPLGLQVVVDGVRDLPPGAKRR